MTQALRFDRERNQLLLGGRRIVFHCHHYNLFLQQTVSDALQKDAKTVEVAASSEASHLLLLELLSEEERKRGKLSFSAKIAFAQQMFMALGFGYPEVAQLTPAGGIVTLTTSHYALGWHLKMGRAKTPVCHFATGFWIGALVAALGIHPDRVFGEETRCIACEGPENPTDSCQIELEVL